MKDGFIRCGCAVPDLKVADCNYNAEEIIKAVREAADNGCSLLTLPELCITGYTCGDLFLSKTLLNGAANALRHILEETAELEIVFIVGLPVTFSGKLFNCAAVCCKGEILGLVPKKNIPNYSEFYEARHFTPWSGSSLVFIDELDTYMGDFLFCDKNNTDFIFGVEICEDLWVPCSPSEELALRGALIICNPSASDEVIGKKEYRRKLVEMQSAKLVCGYIYTDCGFGESTQDMIFSGHSMIYENGSRLAESKPFSSGIIYGDMDLERLAGERRRMNTYPRSSDFKYERMMEFELDTEKELTLGRYFPRTPFVPSDKSDLAARCEEILTMQATGLATRLRHIGGKTAVIGLSGGLDSTLALIVTVHAFDMLSLDRKGIIAITMPCFGTTKRTKSNALTLAEEYGASIREIDISASVRQHFKDIGQSEDVHDVSYENGQARERTQVIMDIANMTGGIVIGTGDLSELALGWATYNGDHMSMYGVNCSIPKTLVRHLVAYEADRTSGELSRVLEDILDTPVSPELLPPSEDGMISQKTEDIVGPYELHDFFLYYMVRCGFSPKKIFRIAKIAFEGAYSDDTILKWLRIFVRRFFSQQFKRSCLPDGPKVGSVTLSPRGDWRMPSDASAALWLSELDDMNIV
ncbi:MAG: NAD(+) synthase [Oscillospiraceae bacterium]|nr:NAD(+) synthase [Oscillospiraceae bacterium]